MKRSGSESGEKWEVRRGYISTARAERVVRSALWIAGQHAMVGIHQRRPFSVLDRTRGLSETGVNLKSIRNSSPGLLDDPRSRDAIELIEQMYVETDDSSGGFLISRQVVAGRIGWHVDNEGYTSADDSLSVNAAGRCRLGVKGTDGIAHYFNLNVGDAFYLDNSGSDHMRPPHTVRNIGLKSRVAVID